VPDLGRFEPALARLEEIVRQLEEGDLVLERGLALYEEGVGLARECAAILDVVDRRIEVLSGDPDGINLHPLEPTDEE
jgi:exodeoxyribonuclease VII small subunit